MKLAIIKNKKVVNIIIGNINDYPNAVDVSNLDCELGFSVTLDGSFADERVVKSVEKLVLSKDILQKLPLGTKRKLRTIRDSIDYSNATSSQIQNGDIADLLLAIIESGDPINVNSSAFALQVGWMIGQSALGITQSHINAITE